MFKKRIITILSFCLVFGTTTAQDTVFTEDFQTGIPATWGLRNLDNHTPATAVSEYTSPWISKIDPLDTNNINLTASSTSFFNPVGTANRWLISPGIVLGAYGNFVTWKARSHDASYPDSYMILASKTDTAIASFTDTVANVIGEYVDWHARTSNLSILGLDNQTVYLAFVLLTNDGFKMYLDDIVVYKNDPVSLPEINAIDVAIKTIDAKGYYEITGDFTQISCKVMNSLGQKNSKNFDSKIDLRNESPGIYYLSIETNKGTAIKKVIKY